MAEQPFNKEITGEAHGLNQLLQQKPGIEWNEGSQLDFLDATRLAR